MPPAIISAAPVTVPSRPTYRRPRRACRAPSRSRGRKSDVVKKALLALALAFVIYYLVTEPVGAADAVRNAASAVGTAFESIVAFFSRLLR